MNGTSYSLLFNGFVVLHRANAEQHAKKCVDCRNSSDYLFAEREVPNIRQSEVEGTKRRKEILGNPFKHIICFVGHTVSPFHRVYLDAIRKFRCTFL